MTEELLYTSAPRGLKPGSSGFCTVVSTQGMSAPLAQALEALSGYRHLYPPGDPQAALNPVVYSHLILSAGGKTYNVLSRISDYGLDYSHRTNKLAHHLVVGAAERPAAGPAWLLSQPGVLDSTWDGEVRIQPTGRSVPFADLSPAPCKTWEQVTGDAGWAGVLAQSWLENPERLAFLRFDPGLPLLELICEALALIPPERRWAVTFSTYATTLPQNVTCQWRCLLNGSKEANDARRFVRDLQWNLSQPMGPAPDTPAAEAARCGQLVVHTENAESSDDSLELGDALLADASISVPVSRAESTTTYRLQRGSRAATTSAVPPLPVSPVRRLTWGILLAIASIFCLTAAAVFAVSFMWKPPARMVSETPEMASEAEQPVITAVPSVLPTHVEPAMTIDVKRNAESAATAPAQPTAESTASPVPEMSATPEVKPLTPDSSPVSAGDSRGQATQPAKVPDKPDDDIIYLGAIQAKIHPLNAPIGKEAVASLLEPVLFKKHESRNEGSWKIKPDGRRLELVDTKGIKDAVKIEILMNDSSLGVNVKPDHTLGFWTDSALAVTEEDSVRIYVFHDKNELSAGRKHPLSKPVALPHKLSPQTAVAVRSCALASDSGVHHVFSRNQMSGSVQLDAYPEFDKVELVFSRTEKNPQALNIKIETTPSEDEDSRKLMESKDRFFKLYMGRLGELGDSYSQLHKLLVNLGVGFLSDDLDRFNARGDTELTFDSIAAGRKQSLYNNDSNVKQYASVLVDMHSEYSSHVNFVMGAEKRSRIRDDLRNCRLLQIDYGYEVFLHSAGAADAAPKRFIPLGVVKYQ